MNYAKANEIQDAIVRKIIESGNQDKIACSFIAATGFGKSFVFFKLLYALLDKGWLSYKDTVCYWAETNIRWQNMVREAKKFSKIFGNNPLEDFIVKWPTYQGGYQKPRVMDVYDEYDFALTAKYSINIRQSSAKYKIGFSATLNEPGVVYAEEWADILHEVIRQPNALTKKGVITSMVNKGQLSDIVLPNVFTYTMQQAIADGLVVSYKTTVIEHPLSTVPDKIRKWKSKEGMCSELEYYNAREYMRRNGSSPAFQRKKGGLEQAYFVSNLPSKVEVVQKLLSSIKGKTILFANDTSLLYAITKNVVTNPGDASFVVNTTNGHCFYSRSKGKTGKMRYKRRNILSFKYETISEKGYKAAHAFYLEHMFRPSEQIISDFEEGRIQVIASAQKIGRGITLNGIENAVLISYNSSSTPLIQKLGRIVRKEEGKQIANLYIIKTVLPYHLTSRTFTPEEKWFEEMIVQKDSYGEVRNVVDLNITNTVKSTEL